MSRATASGAPFEVALRLALLALILDGSLFWFQRLPVLVTAGLGLVLPGASRSSGLWLLLVLGTSWPLVWNWPFSDNHDYLRALLCLAVWCSLKTPDPRKSLALSARLLLGLTFAFATLWKVVLSPDFLDGTFFRVTFLTDGRFEDLAVLLGGMTYEAWEANGPALDAFLSGSVAWAGSGFSEPPALVRLARITTFYTASIEAAVAVAFLWPGVRGPARVRDAVLLLFAVTTFAFATVRGFGWLLMTLGVAQSDPQRPARRLAYVVTFFLIEVYRSVPFGRELAGWLGFG